MYDLRGFLAMMRDPVRAPAYERAIAEVVRPGDLVLDLGCGPGMLSWFALQAGAAHVYAVDTNPLVETMRVVARANGLLDRVTVFHADAREIDIPKVDVIVADVRAALPISRDNLKLLRQVRDQHLKPGGRMIPQQDELWLAPVDCPEAHALVAGWRGSWGGVSHDVLAEQAAATMFRQRIRAQHLIAPGQPMGTLSYDAELPGTLQRSLTFTATRASTCHGVAGWFKATLSPSVGYDTSPESPITVYDQGFFPFARAHSVQAGDEIRLEVQARRLLEHAIWVWKLHIDGPGRAAPAREERWSMGGELQSQRELERRRPDHIPTLGEEDLVDRATLELVDGHRTVETIARELASRFPQRFTTWQDALGQVARATSRGR